MKNSLLFAGILALTPAFSVNAADSTFTPDQVKQIQEVVHQYLVKNPQVLVEASEALRDQMQKGQEKVAMSAIKDNSKVLFNDPNTPVIGPNTAQVSIVEFFDYQCGHCKDMSKTIDSLVSKNTNLRVVFKELPIFGNSSEYAAKAAIASVKQGKFYPFHQALMETKGPLNNETVLKIAKSVGIDTDLLAKQMEAPEVKGELKQNFKLAQDLQLAGTPAFIVANKAGTQFGFIPGATSEQALNAQIAKVNS